MDKLKKRWGITSNWQLFLILVVFSVNGMLAVQLANPVTDLIGMSRETTNGWIFWPIRILLIFPIYQILLVAIGALFGQYHFFWNMEKKMLRRMGLKRFLKEPTEI